jgi:protein phosphatase
VTLRFRAGAATDVGRVRDHNEDGYLVDDTLGLIAVADGMGGHRGGEVASAAALDALRIAFGAGATIDGAVATANEIVHEQSLADRNLRGMGTTLTAGALGIDGTLTLGHVGDSRAYLVRDGELARITTDHSLVEELIRAGELTEEEAERDPRRSRITRALGLEPSVTVDLESVDLRDGDRLLLCSDGLTTMVREDEIAALVVDEDDPEEVARRLVDTANEHGGVDNITVVIIDIQEDGEELPEPDDSDDATDEDETMLVEAVSDGTEDDSPASENETPKKKRGLGRFFGRGK